MKNRINDFREAFVYSLEDVKKIKSRVLNLCETLGTSIDTKTSELVSEFFISKKMFEESSLCVFSNNDSSLIFFDNILWIFTKNADESDTLINYVESVFTDLIKKIIVTDKDFVDSFFINDISNNLLEVILDSDSNSNGNVSDFLYGSQLNYSSIYEEILQDEDIEILSYKIQPIDCNDVITLRFENRIDFGSHTEQKRFVELIGKISHHVDLYIKGKSL